MPTDTEPKVMVGSRQQFKSKPDPPRSSLPLPPALMEDGDDCQDDAACAVGKNRTFNLNQSIFQMITAAGSKADFHSRLDTSESEDNADEDAQSDGGNFDPLRSPASPRHTRIKSSSYKRLLQSTPHLGPRRSPYLRDRVSGKSMILEDKDTTTAGPSSPVLGTSQTEALSVQAEAHMASAALGVGLVQTEAEAMKEEEDERKESVDLARRLMEIFDFSAPEDVIAEYPCWLLKTVLLQGYIYITARHDVPVKRGYLSKRGKSNPKYNRYWFILKGDVLSYYANPGDLYFVRDDIDLRYGVSAAVTESPEHGKESTYFTVTTDQRTYYFKADSASSAKEWVKSLQKIIFRSHNEGDSVKFVLPIENILEVEESPVIEFADTLKLKVYDDNETYAIDEYFFSFFSFGKEALNLLRSLSDQTHVQQPSSPHATSAPDNSKQDGSRSQTPLLSENVRATFRSSTPYRCRSGKTSPAHPLGGNSPRRSTEYSRSSFEVSRRSAEIQRERLQIEVGLDRHSTDISRDNPASPQYSADSFVQSFNSNAMSDSDAYRLSSDEESASQILSGSGVFKSPTFKNRRSSSKTKKHNRNESSGSAVSQQQKAPKHIVVHPSSQSNVGTLSMSKKQIGLGSDSDMEKSSAEKGKKSPSLQDILKTGGAPLQRAAGWADWMKQHSKKILASDPMSYIEKVSDMWSGGTKHFGQPMGAMPNEQVDDEEDEYENDLGPEERFRAHFPSCKSDKLNAVYFGYIQRVLPLYGKIYISERHFCFRSIVPGTRTKVVLPLKDIENVDKEKGFRFGYSGLVLVIRGHEELFFEFGAVDTRDDCWVVTLQNLESIRHMKESILLSEVEKEGAERAKRENRLLEEARQDGHADHDLQLPKFAGVSSSCSDAPPIIFDDPHASVICFKPQESLRITCLTIGSRGDVQPYIALCKGFLKEGHKPRIATHAEFQPWIESHGIEFAKVEGDPAELMRICIENGVFTVSFLREASSKFRGWIDELLESAWEASKGSDILIESPSAMAGIHIAEALGIPYFRAFTMPWTRTRAYPHAFAVPEHKMGGAYNYYTYVMFDNVFWKAISGQVNRWRKNSLKLGRTSLNRLRPNKVPFLYNFSPSVVAPPLDYSEWIRVTGYWFLEEQENWTAPQDLLDFIAKARADNKKLVYVGFGSIVVSDPVTLTRTVVESVLKAGVRCILAKGWSDRLGSKDQNKAEIPLPPEIHQIQSAPHDWLFRQIDAATHHGGAGTTGASLRAGIPTIIKPFFGDQFFFGGRVEDLGVGICVKKLNVNAFSKALWQATHDDRMIVKARVLGEQIRSENGVETAIQAIYRDMEYARTLIKTAGRTAGQGQGDDSEESWTFIGDESDPELIRRLAPMLGEKGNKPEEGILDVFGKHDHAMINDNASEATI